MIQTQISHPAGTFAPCSGCRREPHHIEARGRAAHEPIDFTNPSSSVRHQLECSRCGRTTAKHPTLAGAEAEWGAAYAQGELAFPQRRRRVA